MLTQKYQKVSTVFSCETCAYNTVTKSNYKKHLLTAKHCLLTDVNKKVSDVNTKVSESIAQYTCSNCNKNYKSRVGLWGHIKKCSQKTDEKESETSDSNTSPTPPVFTAELVLALVSQNKELQNILIEQNNKFMEMRM